MQTLCCLILLALPVVAHDPPWWTEKCNQFVYFAIYEGLLNDGVDNSDVQKLLADDPITKESLFVAYCPLCEATRDALRSYVARPNFHDSLKPASFGKGLSEERRKKLHSGTAGDRANLLEELVKTYMTRRFEMVKMTDVQKAMLREQIEVGRKIGMSSLSTSRDKSVTKKFCPICESCVGSCPLIPK